MQKQIMMAALVLVLGVGSAVPAVGQDFDVIGYTAVVRNGAQGILVFNEDCDNAFPGVGARVCSSGDFIRGNLPDRPADPAPGYRYQSHLRRPRVGLGIRYWAGCQ
jgi:hypothetical protein